MRRLALLSVLAIVAVTPSAHGVAHVVGGSPVDVRSAPWSVLVLYRSGASAAACSGAIIDPVLVLTAAHCAVERGVPVPAASLSVRAGVSNAADPSSTDSPQERAVSSFRVHRGYADDDRSGADDVAVLILASPLDLSGPAARAIALPGPSLRLTGGESVSVAGYGLKVRGGTVDGTLNGMNATLVDQRECLRAPYDTGNAVLLCAFSGSSSPCGGDSGSALVLTAPTPVLVGVTRAASCSGNSSASYANVTAPEILEFVRGNDNPPPAPRPASPPTLERPTATMQVGQTVRCLPGSWSGAPTFSYGFYAGASRTLLRHGPAPTYVLSDADAWRTILCRVTATNAGGTGFDESAVASQPVQNAPELSVAEAAAPRGGTAVLRVRLVDWVRPLGAVTICAKLSPRIGGRTCRTAMPAGLAPAPVVVRLPVKGSAPVVRARVQVTARAADGRAAGTTGFVSVGR